ncbi:SLATT domain-containing protein [Orbaceae bacterium ac157xtp]
MNSKEDYKLSLEHQIREAYGKVVYSQTCHHKMAERYYTWNGVYKWAQIILSALVSCSVVSIFFFYSDFWSKAISAILSVFLTAINLYLKNCNLVEDAKEHQNSAHELWKIREEYVSLLTDLNELNVNEIIQKRDELQDRTYQIYKNSLKTDSKSYKKAQQSLKNNEEQTFSEREIDIMLPISLRKSIKRSNTGGN